MEIISIEVESEIARAYQDANLIERQKMQILVNGWLKQIMSKRSLEQIIQEMQTQSQINGLTQEILTDILNSEDT
jgi:hypothetical protein